MATKPPVISDDPSIPAPPERQLPATHRRRMSLTWLWFLITAALCYAGFRYYQSYQQKQQAEATALARRSGPRAVSAVVQPVKLGDIPVYLRGLGSVAAFNTVTVKSRVDGQLIAIHFTEGQSVKKGDLIAEIDPRPFLVQLQQAEGQLAKDKAQLTDAQANLARYEALWNEKVIARQQLDTQRAQVSQFEGVIESDQAAIENAKLQLTYSKITAPISGRVGLRLVDVGNIVHASDQNGLIVIAQLQPITVLFNIPADNLPPVLQKLRVGTKLHVDAYDHDDRNKIATGTLLTVDNQIDATTGTSRLKAVFENHDNALFPNQFVNCRLLLDTKHNVVIVPAAVIQRGPQGTYAYVVKPDQTVTVRPITVGITEGDNVEIAQGLKEGDIVVVEGQDKLQEGSKVDARGAGQKPGRRKRAQ